MYAYQKATNLKKKIIISGILAIFLVSMVVLQILRNTSNDDVAVVKEEDNVVISLPDKEQKIIAPFNVDASVVIEYFDGSDHEVNDYTLFENIYRPNQGIDYSFNQESFDVINMLDGKVTQVKEDELFGNTITVTSGELEITYQSLDALNYKENDTIKQGDIIAKSSINTYNSDLSNHLHIACTYKGNLIDPKSIIDKSVNDLE